MEDEDHGLGETDEGRCSQLIRVNREDRLINTFQSAAGERFAQREYKGLLFSVPDEHDITIKQGVFGIAAGYALKETTEQSKST